MVQEKYTIMDKNRKEKGEKEIKRLWGSIKEVFIENFDVLNDRIVLRLDNKNIPQIYLEKKRIRVRKDDFAIKLNDLNKELSTKDMGADEILLHFIKYIGIDKVQNLNLKATGDEDLISNNEDFYNRRKILDGKYVFVKTPNTEKINVIRKIIKEIPVNAEIIDL